MRTSSKTWALGGATAAATCFAAALLVGCARAPLPPPVTPEISAEQGPRLVVVVVIDQLAAWSLERYADALDADGAIRRGSAEGVRATVRYPYAASLTAPGHAAIFTGTAPSESGIVANRVFDPRRGAMVPAFDDGVNAVLGVEGAFASPAALQVDTVADALGRATSGQTRVVAVSFKDRGVIPGAGRQPDAALWYDARSGRFTTSHAYANALPEWLEAFERDHPLEEAITVWEPTDPELLERFAGPDDAPGEGPFYGLGTVFPHDLREATHPPATLLVAPQGTERLVALAEAAVDAYGLGTDDVPDLLSISISGTDYAGHIYGQTSWEFLDHLIRADRAIGALLRRLEERTTVAVLITSDHGAAPLPEAQPDEDSSGRIAGSTVRDVAEAAIEEALGPGDYIAAFVDPYLYLKPAAEAPEARQRAVEAIVTALGAHPQVHAAYDVRDAEALRASDDPISRAVGLSLHPDAGGDVFVVPAEGHLFDAGMPGGTGTNHGSPWTYDRDVPVIFWGPGVAPSELEVPLDQRRVAPTISALLGAPPPTDARQEALPGAPGAPRLP